MSEELTPIDAATELSVNVEDEGVLVVGAPEVVDAYIRRIRDISGAEAKDVGLDAAGVAAAGATAAGVANIAMQRGRFVLLSPNSMANLRKYDVVPAGNGFNRMTVVDSAKQFRGQLTWKQVPLGPSQVAAVQMLAVQMALKTAIASVEEAVERVEDKVDEVLALAKAQVAGDVIGNHAVLKRLDSEVKRNDSLPTADWESIAGLGPGLEVGIERLRAYITQKVQPLDASISVQDRADVVHKLVADNKIGEALQLLVIAEQSLFLWQQLRLRRVIDTDPRNREAVAVSVREVLREQVARDGELWNAIGKEMETYGRIAPLDRVHFFGIDSFKQDVKALQDDLDAFGTARRMQVLGWEDHRVPSIQETISEIGTHVSRTWGSGVKLGEKGIRTLGGRFRREPSGDVVADVEDKQAT